MTYERRFQNLVLIKDLLSASALMIEAHSTLCSSSEFFQCLAGAFTATYDSKE